MKKDFNQTSRKSPKISVITVVLNGENYLEETILSVKNQSFKDFEYIIIDGGSTDGSLEIISRYNDIIDYCISEKDRGIYDAFNKGMQVSRGKYLGFVNSDDVLMPNALEILNKYDNNNPEIDFIFGSVKKHWGILHGYKPSKINYSWGFYSSHSTGFFIKKESAKKVGLYDLRYKYHSDYDYFYRMIVKNKLQGIGTKKEELFGVFRRGGFSSTVKFKDLLKEDMQIRIRNGQNIFFVFFISVYKVIRHIIKIIQK
jgi:glycosyltransferase involved in cell wall biosynthesis